MNVTTLKNTLEINNLELHEMIKNKNIIITGISRGLGKELCYKLSKNNKIYGISRSNYKTKNKNIIHYKCDLSDENQIKVAVSDIFKQCGSIHILINNAAVLKTMPISLMNDKDIKDMVTINLLGSILMTKYVFRYMAQKKYGRIINISSMAPKISAVGDSVYAATKAGLESFSRVINKEGHGINITVNNIGITGLYTGMLKQIVGDNPDIILDIIPHKNLASIDSIIKIIEFICGENSEDIGSQTIYLGGIS